MLNRGEYIVSVSICYITQKNEFFFSCSLISLRYANLLYQSFSKRYKKVCKICTYSILKSFFDRLQLYLPLKTIVCKINILFKIISMIKFLLRTQTNVTLCKVWQQVRWGAWALTWRSWHCPVSLVRDVLSSFYLFCLKVQ